MILIVAGRRRRLNMLTLLQKPHRSSLLTFRVRRHDGLHYGLYVPNFGKTADAHTFAELAYEAEISGWDGFFLWDHLIQWDQRIPICDSFIALAAMALNTKNIRIGTTVTPLPKLKPWIVARQTASLDNLSNGRMILGVGIGEEESTDYERWGEVADKKILAEKLDESLEIIAGLWRGKSFSYEGKHYSISKKTAFLPAPKQKPRIPVWVGGFRPRKRPFRRAAKWDGVLPLHLGHPIRPEPKHLRDILTHIKEHRTSTAPFDVAIIGWNTGKDRAKNLKKIGPYAEEGLTWWLESLYTKRDSAKEMRARIRMGPPRI
jgi:alkanesulfonate monooxygenase SsuD/methylene tetrahydromethanopterin reductase-like flavin-dependent oxidoreductase (luciferase family)